jgi:hypothetical protein
MKARSKLVHEVRFTAVTEAFLAIPTVAFTDIAGVVNLNWIKGIGGAAPPWNL